MLKRNVETNKTVTAPKCLRCTAEMRVVKIIPKAHIFPELRTYRCSGCGWLRTVQDETELSTAEMPNVAA